MRRNKIHYYNYKSVMNLKQKISEYYLFLFKTKIV